LTLGTETLLVVEDEPALRHLASTVLKTQGYHVLEASNGVEGVRVVSDYKGPPIRLVIADVIMPLMGGKALAELLKMTNPDIEILFTSGYPDDAIMRHGVLDPSFGFLGKPYSPAILARKVREMLDKEPMAPHEGMEAAQKKSENDFI
jgi:response regulator RpfG family c-di-GMP phosphodiesterase